MREFHCGPEYAGETAGLQGVAVRELPLPQESYVMGNAATVRTLEGPVSYPAGWVLSEGAEEELYAFEQSYMETNMDIEGSPVTAVIPDGISSLDPVRSMAGPGFVVRKKAGCTPPATAYLIDEPFRVTTSWGQTMNGKPGDRLVEDDGAGACSRWIVDADVFRRTYLV